MKVLLLCLLSCLTVRTEEHQPFSCNDEFFNYIQLINYADINTLGYQSNLNRIETSITEMKHSLRRNAMMERLFYASKEYGGSYYLARRVMVREVWDRFNGGQQRLYRIWWISFRD